MIIDSDDVWDEINEWNEDGTVISDDAAQTIASWWHSPSPRDVAITALSHGLDYDPDDLLDEVEREAAAAGDPDDLAALIVWIEAG